MALFSRDFLDKNLLSGPAASGVAHKNPGFKTQLFLIYIF